jgi:hypothetical protein
MISTLTGQTLETLIELYVDDLQNNADDAKIILKHILKNFSLNSEAKRDQAIEEIKNMDLLSEDEKTKLIDTKVCIHEIASRLDPRSIQNYEQMYRIIEEQKSITASLSRELIA